jgi:prevent-host-death family protein
MVKVIEKDSMIGLKELRDNVDLYIAAVKKGKRFTVLRHSKPVFAIVPVEEVEYDLDELDGPGWKTLIDFTKIKKGGVPADEVLAALRRVRGQDR